MGSRHHQGDGGLSCGSYRPKEVLVRGGILNQSGLQGVTL